MTKLKRKKSGEEPRKNLSVRESTHERLRDYGHKVRKPISVLIDDYSLTLKGAAKA